MKFLRSKLSIPETAKHFIYRQRLIDKFIKKPDVNLFLFIAPAGYGKTTLSVQFLAKYKKILKSWYHIDRQDVDPKRFLAYLIETLSISLPFLQKSDLISKLVNKNAGIIEIVDDLCFYLQEYKGRDVWLVLDNWELIDKQTDICSIITQLISYGGTKLKIIINSRVRPSLHIQKLKVNNKAEIITQKEMAFNLTEFDDVIKTRLNSQIKEKELEQLWKLTSGWCVNIGLILEILQKKGIHHSTNIIDTIKGSNSIEEYMEDELLSEVAPELLDFLAKSSVFDVLSDETCSIIYKDRNKIKKYLNLLKNSSIPCFVLPEKNSYRLHPLLRQSASNVFKQNYSNDVYHELYMSASDYYLSNKQIIESIALLIDLPDYEAALELINNEWFAIVQQNNQAQISKWLDQFPKKKQTHPLYIKIKTNIFSMTGQNIKLVEYLSKKLKPKFFGKSDPIHGNLWFQMQWAYLFVVQKPYYQTLKKKWIKFNKEFGPFGGPIKAAVEHILGVSAGFELQYEPGIKHLQKAIEYYGEESRVNQVVAQNNISFLKHNLGRSEPALAEYDSTIKTCISDEMFAPLPIALVNKGLIENEMGRLTESLETIEQCEDICLKYNLSNIGVLVDINRIKGTSLWYLGEKIEGIEYLKKAYQLASKYGQHEMVNVGILIEYYNLLNGNIEEIIKAEDIPPAKSQKENRLPYLVKCSVGLILEEQYDESKQYIEELLKVSTKCKLIPWQVSGNFLMAYCLYKAKGNLEFKKYLKKGLTLLEKLNWDSYLLANDLITGFVYSKAIRYNILSGTAARLISGDFIIDLTSVFNDELDHGRCTAVEKSRLIKSAIDLEIRGLNKSISKCTDRSNKELVRLSRKYLKKIKEVSLPDLNIKLLGQFTALSKGKLLPIKRKKSKMLFQILLIEHPRPIHEEKIIEFLWPDSNLSKGKSILQTSVGDLRKALDPLYEPRGKSYIKYTNQQYYLELPDGSQIDTFIFEDTLKKGMISIDKNYVFDDSSEKEINRALGMYKGELIPEQRYEDYSIEYGERLQKLYLDGILAFSKYLYKKNRYDEGITVLRNGLKLDPLWGQGVEQLMKIQVKNDNLFQAMKTYRNYEKLLKKELDLSPDREISYFFNDIIRQINNI